MLAVDAVTALSAVAAVTASVAAVRYYTWLPRRSLPFDYELIPLAYGGKLKGLALTYRGEVVDSRRVGIEVPAWWAWGEGTTTYTYRRARRDLVRIARYRARDGIDTAAQRILERKREEERASRPLVPPKSPGSARPRWTPSSQVDPMSAEAARLRALMERRPGESLSSFRAAGGDADFDPFALTRKHLETVGNFAKWGHYQPDLATPATDQQDEPPYVPTAYEQSVLDEWRGRSDDLGRCGDQEVPD